jgi:hypothetical protein
MQRTASGRLFAFTKPRPDGATPVLSGDKGAAEGKQGESKLITASPPASPRAMPKAAPGGSGSGSFRPGSAEKKTAGAGGSGSGSGSGSSSGQQQASQGGARPGSAGRKS